MDSTEPASGPGPDRTPGAIARPLCENWRPSRHSRWRRQDNRLARRRPTPEIKLWRRTACPPGGIAACGGRPTFRLTESIRQIVVARLENWAARAVIFPVPIAVFALARSKPPAVPAARRIRGLIAGFRPRPANSLLEERECGVGEGERVDSDPLLHPASPPFSIRGNRLVSWRGPHDPNGLRQRTIPLSVDYSSWPGSPAPDCKCEDLSTAGRSLATRARPCR